MCIRDRCDYLQMGFDACSEFAPGPYCALMKDITLEKEYVCDTFVGKVYDYKDFVLEKKYFQLKRENAYRAVTPMWDNTPRRKNKEMCIRDSYRSWEKATNCLLDL